MGFWFSLGGQGRNRAMATRTPVRILLSIAGTCFLGLGAVGVFVPVLPTTPFLLLAAACYARSSTRFYGWLLNNRWCGKYIKSYREEKGIPLSAKVLAMALLWLTIGFSIAFVVSALALRLILVAIVLAVSIHIMSIRTLKG